MATVKEDLPEFLRPYVVKQNTSLYSPIDHASWRFIMLVARDFFARHAHPSYLPGLAATGVSTERIPTIAEMDIKLRSFGWRAVAVTGFIPPAIFLELLSMGILPIACDMRKLEHIDYTPAPDIVHEAAGHAPLLADPKYASYLRKFGQIARYAIFSQEDQRLYEAILYLSEVKEDPGSSEDQIELAEAGVRDAYAKVTYVSEAAQVSRLGWWSTEYGLLQGGEKPLIYGAGLLSSLAESYAVFRDAVPKFPLTIDCVHVNYDITKPQPQLFYVEDLSQLEGIVEELAQGMAFRVGGKVGTDRALAAGTVTTVVLNTGLAVSGVLQQCTWSDDLPETPYLNWLKYSGPVQLSYGGEQLAGHGAAYHTHGFSSPLGYLQDLAKPLSELSESEFKERGWDNERLVRLVFASGIEVSGILRGVLRRDGKCLLMTFAECTVRKGAQVFFAPDWGLFDMACGEQVISVYGGAAERGAYLRETGNFSKTSRAQKVNSLPSHRRLERLYQKVRDEREKLPGEVSAECLSEVAQALERNFPQEWLLRLELVELAKSVGENTEMATRMMADLARIATTSPQLNTLIGRGLQALGVSKESIG